jgi:hypothetical protein
MRDIVLGNGTMMLNFDQDLNLRDLYWPMAVSKITGTETGPASGYLRPPVQLAVLLGLGKGIGLSRRHPITNIRAVITGSNWNWKSMTRSTGRRCLPEKNCGQKPPKSSREVKVIFYQDLSIKGIEAGDSAVYDPKTGGIYHYKKSCYIWPTV